MPAVIAPAPMVSRNARRVVFAMVSSQVADDGSMLDLGQVFNGRMLWAILAAVHRFFVFHN
jgi:hypothetical protein